MEEIIFDYDCALLAVKILLNQIEEYYRTHDRKDALVIEITQVEEED